MTGNADELRNQAVGGRSALPVVRNFDSEIAAPERRRLAGLAEKLLRDEPSLNSTDFFGELVFAGLTQAPAVLLGDQREIGLHETMPAQHLEHRIALLASAGDFLVVERDCPAYEQYLAEVLGFDDLRVIALGPPPLVHVAPVASRCRESGAVLSQLASAARGAGQFQIMPHIGAGSAWSLAGAIAREAGVPVAVAAPPPRLTRRVNDKIWFASLVREVLGPGAGPPTSAAFGPAAVAARIARIARQSERIIVKTPDSAGSMGNVVIEAERVRQLDLAQVRDLVLAMLRGRGWRGRFPLQVGVWEAGAMASPSVQIWIPARDDGCPVLEGLFEQRLSSPGAEFVGAVPAQLPKPIVGRIISEAMRLATLLQDLGYFGRCSFDCLVTGASGGRAEVHWIECNGRWGGVSVPMTFLNRLVGNHLGHGMVIVQDSGREICVKGVGEALTRLGPLLLRRGATQGVVPLSAGCLDRGRGIHFMAFAPNQEQAGRLAAEAVARLAV